MDKVELNITFIIVALCFALFYRWFLPELRAWLLLVASLLILFWFTDSWGGLFLGSTTIVLTTLVWWFTRPSAIDVHDTLYTLGIALVFIVILVLTTTNQSLLSLLGLLLVVGGSVFYLAQHTKSRQWSVSILIGLLIVLFVILKLEPLNKQISAWWTQQDDLTAASPVIWLGYSYIAFRLLHILLDWRSGRLQAVSLRETLTYTIFFPAIFAGPIDRIERFTPDYRGVTTLALPDIPGVQSAAERIVLGIVKKFIVADIIAMLTFGEIAIDRLSSPLAAWVVLYVYGIRLFLDFSGYTDIAIGIGMLLGIRLPENFARPYFKQNIAAFWQSWHITLSNWARFYIFAPLTRNLLRRKRHPSLLFVSFIAQVTTMLIIGLWHGISWTYLVWGIWHGLGLFIHKIWSDRTRRVYMGLQAGSWQKRSWSVAGWFITLQFVMLGWVWFALPDFVTAASFMGKLFGIGW